MINSFSLSQLANRFGGSIVNSNHVMFESVSTDTRTIQSGDLFVALIGENFDGHSFIDKAIAAGVAGIVVSREMSDVPLPQWVVKDTTIALGFIAQFQRDFFTGKLVGITGSGGKTTVKGMLSSILQAAAGDEAVFATQGNFNNHIGVPLSLFSLNDHHQYAVIEMGASALGEIKYLTGIAKPDVAVVNNVMPAHVEGFGSIDNIAIAKGEIYNGLTDTGTAVINIDDHYSAQWVKQNNHRDTITFSAVLNESADVTISAAHLLDNGEAIFTLHIFENRAEVHLQVLGRHNINNALAASSCAHGLGISIDIIAKGLNQFSGVDGRLQKLAGCHGSIVIDDSYNANPGSVRAAIDVLTVQPVEQKILILGDLGELGCDSGLQHADLGAYALANGVTRLLTVGSLAENASKSFGKNGVAFKSCELLIDNAKHIANNNTVFLIKGSRSSRMERVVQALKQRGDNNATLVS